MNGFGHQGVFGHFVYILNVCLLGILSLGFAFLQSMVAHTTFAGRSKGSSPDLSKTPTHALQIPVSTRID